MLKKIVNNNIVTEILNLKNVLRNPAFEIVYEHIIQNDEGYVGMNGALIVDTGEFTGRYPKDKYFVEENTSKDDIWWGTVNQKVHKEVYNIFLD